MVIMEKQAIWEEPVQLLGARERLLLLTVVTEMRNSKGSILLP